MTVSFDDMIASLTKTIETAYTEGVTADEAEKYAAKFLAAQLLVSNELTAADLDARMRKSGNKAIRARVYMEAKADTTQKLTEAGVQAIIDTHEIVQKEQDGLDAAEVRKAELERYYDIFLNGHIYMRGVAKGSFG